MTVIIQSGFVGTSEDLNHPRIGYVSRGLTISSTGTDAAGFAAANALTPLTYTAWEATTAGQYWRNTFAIPRSIGYVGIAVHNAADVGATLVIQKLTGGSWTNWASGVEVTPTTNDTIMFILDPEVVDGISVGSIGGAARIGVIRAGPVMEWPRKARWTGLPITESRQYRYNVNESDSGNWLGRTAVSAGDAFDVQIDNLSETFRSGDFADFAAHCNAGDGSFFIAPRPLSYPNEVAYAWSTETVRMTREIPNKSVSGSVNLSLQGYRAP